MPRGADLLEGVLPVDAVRVKIFEFAEPQHQTAAARAQLQLRTHAGEEPIEVVAIDQQRSEALRRRLPAIGPAAEITQHQDAERSIRARLNRLRTGAGVYIESYIGK